MRVIFSIFLLLQGVNVEANGLTVFSCKLIAHETYVIGKPITVEFEIANHTDDDISFLPWGLPIEGFWSRLYTVTKDGKNIPYQGPLIKREAPSADEYIVIAKGSTLKQSLDLSQAYELSQSGRYSVSYEGHIQSWFRLDNKGNRVGSEQQFTDICCPTIFIEIQNLKK